MLVVNITHSPRQAGRLLWEGKSVSIKSPSDPPEPCTIKERYCTPIAGLLGTEFRDMMVVPIRANGIMLGAIKLINHSDCEECEHGSFASHYDDVAVAADELGKLWIKNCPVPCEVIAVYVDIVDSTSIAVTSGYSEAARIFQRFVNEVQTHVDECVAKNQKQPPNSLAAEIGGEPFLDKFTGDGVLVLFPYERFQYRGEFREIAHRWIWPSVYHVIESMQTSYNALRNDPGLARVLREAAISLDPLKVAVSSGPAYVARFGKHRSAIGRPLIEASRILDQKEYYEGIRSDNSLSEPTVLASEQFVDDFMLKECTKVGSHVHLRGLPGRRLIYRLPLSRNRPGPPPQDP